MQYSYQVKDRNIRLLRLELDTYKASIRCHLVEASLDNLPEYEALSYVWGDSTNTEQITCNGQVHHVTVNAARAMRKIRLGVPPPGSKKETADHGTECQTPTGEEVLDSTTMGSSSLAPALDSKVRRYRPQFLWVDAICIDQTNDTERNHQVQLMREIYSKAKRVLVWLGDTKASAKRMSALTATIELLASRFSPVASDLGIFEALPLSRVQSIMGNWSWSEMRLVIHAAFSSDWYTRIWCVQEVLLPRETLLLYRNAVLNSEDMAIFSSWIAYTIREVVDDGVSDFQRDFGVYWNMYSAQERFKSAALTSNNPAETLYNSQRLIAKDPRDKFYGFIGLFEEVLVDVDYRKSVMEVYKDSVLQTAADGLRVLTYVYHGHDYARIEPWPSWVPDWRSSEGLGSLYHYQGKEMRASQQQVSECDQELAHAGILRLEGIPCDRITTATEVLRLPGEAESVTTTRLANLFSDLWQNTTTLSTILSWAKTLNAGGAYNRDTFFLSGAEKQKRLMSDFIAYLASVLPEQVRVSCGDHQLLGDAVAYKKTSLAKTNGRKAFCTNNAWLGLGPECIQPGDVVAVFHGAVSPFVLRPVDDRPDHYYLMGECYVEKLEAEGAYTMLEEGGLKERIFNLI